ncbi:hypothetical protein N7471_008711 [Penicillium samsonianum]|uniref:uncharacterized protein n=1 Tax=Penicillium samsonianum TaxID=1882272 RepID=UPI0025490C13|nr:uncharacterized protein N7471_008711 [Penicillium samsonianum]KAJ6133496.1 hypothetical protein N7471_008711 [Penicillium samsonianum]
MTWNRVAGGTALTLTRNDHTFPYSLAKRARQSPRGSVDDNVTFVDSKPLSDRSKLPTIENLYPLPAARYLAAFAKQVG